MAEKSLNTLLLLLILKSSKFPRSLFNKVAGLRAQNLLKRDSNTRIFPVTFAKFLRAPIFKNIYEPLLMYRQVILFTMREQDTVNKT